MTNSPAAITATAPALAAELAAAVRPHVLVSAIPPDLNELLLPGVERWLAGLTSGDAEPGRALGAELVHIGCIDPEVLSVALPLLAQRLVEAELIVELGAVALSAIATGYATALRERTLQHQEQLYQALRHSRDTARTQLLEESRFVNAILDHMEALVIVATIDEKITRFNKAAERLTGYTVEALNRGEGRPLSTEESLPEVQAAVDKLLTSSGAPRAVSLRTKLRTRSGEARDVAWMMSLLLDDDGNPTHYVGTGIDITAQLQIAVELQEARHQLAEREGLTQRRIARALHDGAVQELLSLGVTVAEMQRRAEADETWTERERLEEIIPGLEMVRRELLGVASGLRQLMAELRPPGLEEMGLRQAVEAFIQGEGLPALPLEVTLDICRGADRLEPGLQNTLFFVIRECLRNVQRHAAATAASVTVSCDNRDVTVVVQDDGRGFVAPERLASLVRRRQFGLMGVQERVELRGGKVEIESAPGSGTVVRAILPFAPSQEEGQWAI
jgi:PAS domain S-box-containing protein